jgi:hypothetical protein
VPISQSSAGKHQRNSGATAHKAVQTSRIRQLRQGSFLIVDKGILNEAVCMTREITSANEQRGSQRFRISAPLTVIAGDREIPAYTRDLSNRGVYFYLALADSALIDRDFEFLIDMPSEITLSASCRIRCRGRLVRKEVTSKNLTGAGVAAEILDYSILREVLTVV